MPKYLPSTEVGGHLAIAICPRCKLKIYYGELETDPDTKQLMCPACVDLRDPYCLPAKEPDRFTLRYPRPEEELIPPEE